MEDLIVNLFESHPYLMTGLTGALAAHGLALFIVNLTPTPKDNEFVGKAYKVIEWVAGVVSKKTKE